MEAAGRQGHRARVPAPPGRARGRRSRRAHGEPAWTRELRRRRRHHLHAPGDRDYTHPEIATVGKTEQEFKDAGVPYKMGKFPFIANGRAKAMGETDGLVEILAHAETDRILGFHVFGAHASDLAAEGAVAIEFSASSEDLARSVHAHPTLSEIVEEAALDVAGRVVNI